jgi:hypothetical protein
MWTEMMTPTMAFRNFANVPKKWKEIIFDVISQEEVSKQWKSETSQATYLQTSLSKEFLSYLTFR